MQDYNLTFSLSLSVFLCISLFLFHTLFHSECASRWSVCLALRWSSVWSSPIHLHVSPHCRQAQAKARHLFFLLWRTQTHNNFIRSKLITGYDPLYFQTTLLLSGTDSIRCWKPFFKIQPHDNMNASHHFCGVIS